MEEEMKLDELDLVSQEDLRSFDAVLTVGELHAAVENAWRDIRRGTAFGGKAVLSLPEDEFWRLPEFSGLREEFAEERLGWKLSSLFSVNARVGAVKVIGANAYNRRLGLPRSTSTILLLDKLTLHPRAILDGTGMSAARTGTYASLVLKHCYRASAPAALFLYGAGPVARSVIECISHSSAHNVEQIFLRSRTTESARRLAGEMANKSRVPISVVADNLKLRDCSVVITATNARQPLFEEKDLADDVVSLHLGGDEVPEGYLQRALRTGLVVCDDIKTVSRRNSQSLALHFSRKGLSLEAVGPILGMREFSSAQNWRPDETGPVCVTCVGLPALDLYVAEATYEKYRRARQASTTTAQRSS
jgi:alanine dehydrogenase